LIVLASCLLACAKEEKPEPPPPAPAPAPVTESDRVQALVRSLVEAIHAGDVDTVLALTHPVAIEKLGGAEAARAALVDMLPEVRKAKVVELTFPAPPEFVEGTENEYVLVPMHTVFDLRGVVFDSRSFQFGVRPKRDAEGWKFVEGPRVRDLLDEFADFPKDHRLPENWMKPRRP
jgi:hypothetical protein